MKRAWKKNLRLFPEILRERLKGVDFSAFEELKDVRSKYNDSCPYERSTPILLRKMFEIYAPSTSDAFIDIGCGKGLVFVHVHDMKFTKLAGVEISGQLVSTARQNMKRLNIDASIIHADAAEFDAYDEYTYIYMFNPFGSQTMRAVANKVRASLTRNPRRLIVAYSHPQHYETWDKMARVTHRLEACIDGLAHAMVVYVL